MAAATPHQPPVAAPPAGLSACLHPQPSPLAPAPPRNLSLRFIRHTAEGWQGVAWFWDAPNSPGSRHRGLREALSVPPAERPAAPQLLVFHRARTPAYLTQADLSGTVQIVMDEAAIEGRHLAIAGLREAVAAIAPPDLVPATMRTSEALSWASVLGDITVPAERHHLYRALQIPRTAVAHGAAVCVGVQNGLVWPITSPLKVDRRSLGASRPPTGIAR